MTADPWNGTRRLFPFQANQFRANRMLRAANCSEAI